MKGLSILQHPDFGMVRSVKTNGEIWFIAKDVCDVLGVKNSRDTLAKLATDEKGVAITDTLGGKQEMATVNESGLYVLLFLSRKPEAQAFRKWVTTEVLPAIRKTGFYVHPTLKMTSAQQRRLNDTMRGLVQQYVMDADVVRIAKRCGRTPMYVRDVMSGYKQNKGIMVMLQEQAIVNKEQMDSPYGIERLQEVVNKLSK